MVLSRLRVLLNQTIIWTVTASVLNIPFNLAHHMQELSKWLPVCNYP